MRLIENIQYRLRQAVAPAVLLALLGYFAYHAVSGNHGLLALKDLEREYETIRASAGDVAAERSRLEARVARLRPDNLDPDLLDERARLALGFTERGEMVIFLDKQP